MPLYLNLNHSVPDARRHSETTRQERETMKTLRTTLLASALILPLAAPSAWAETPDADTETSESRSSAFESPQLPEAQDFSETTMSSCSTTNRTGETR